MVHDVRIDLKPDDYIDYMTYKLRPAASAASQPWCWPCAGWPCAGWLAGRVLTHTTHGQRPAASGQPALRPGSAEAGVAGPSG